MKFAPAILRGERVTLEPMSLDHLDGLAAVGLEPSVWEFTVNRVRDRDAMREYIESALANQGKGFAIPFVTKISESDKIVGSTRFGNIDPENRRVEIGWTWIAPEWQRSFVNTEAKLLMLTHAFEVWGCIRVELKTDALNQRSREAIRRIGAVEEGILRQHMITDTGRFRDTVYFSILDGEWDSVKAGLLARLRGR